MIWNDAALDSSVSQTFPHDFCSDIKEQLQYSLGGFAGFTDDGEHLILYLGAGTELPGDKLVWDTRWQIPVALVRAAFPLTLEARNIWPTLVKKAAR